MTTIEDTRLWTHFNPEGWRLDDVTQLGLPHLHRRLYPGDIVRPGDLVGPGSYRSVPSEWHGRMVQANSGTPLARPVSPTHRSLVLSDVLASLDAALRVIAESAPSDTFVVLNGRAKHIDGLPPPVLAVDLPECPDMQWAEAANVALPLAALASRLRTTPARLRYTLNRKNRRRYRLLEPVELVAPTDMVATLQTFRHEVELRPAGEFRDIRDKAAGEHLVWRRLHRMSRRDERLEASLGHVCELMRSGLLADAIKTLEELRTALREPRHGGPHSP